MTARTKTPPAAEQAECLTAKDLQARWRVSPAAFWRQLKAGRLPHPIRIGPRCVRWLRSEVDAFERRLLEDRSRAKAGEAGGEGGAP